MGHIAHLKTIMTSLSSSEVPNNDKLKLIHRCTRTSPFKLMELNLYKGFTDRNGLFFLLRTPLPLPEFS